MKKVLNIQAPNDFGVVHIGGASVTVKSENGELVIDVHVFGGLASEFFALDEDGDAAVQFRREGKDDLRATLARNGRVHDAPPRDGGTR